MQLWDGMMMNNEQNDHNRILVVGATNRPFDVDGAFLRRMPRSYFVGLPDVKARYAILSQLLKGVPLHATEFNLESIARHVTQGYSPSDMKELLRVAALFPLREARAKAAATTGASSSSSSLSGTPLSAPMALPPLRPLTTQDVLQAQRAVTPTPYSESYQQALTDFITARRPSYPSSPSHGGSHPHYENHSSPFPSFLERPNDYDEEQPQKRQRENHNNSQEEEEEDEGNYDANIGGDDEYHEFSSFDDDDDDDDTGATDSDGDGYLYR
jgi:SpoVK/Ycf46/Vps4 family AAA+-type ATPase